MTADTITLELRGDVGLRQFKDAVVRLETMISALSDEVAKGARIDWALVGLNVGSAVTTIEGRTQVPNQVERVQRAYSDVGDALLAGRPIRYSQRVASEAWGLRELLNGKITALKFETPERDVIVTNEGRAIAATTPRGAYGAVEGRVQSLSNRVKHRITLYDREFDRAVACYLDREHLGEDPERVMLGLWDRRVIVEGWVDRDPVDGRAMTIRRVTHIEPLLEASGPYELARGVVPIGEGMEMPEAIIRRLRDA